MNGLVGMYWHRWFAWRPVHLWERGYAGLPGEVGPLVWLRFIERRRVIDYDIGITWEYRRG